MGSEIKLRMVLEGSPEAVAAFQQAAAKIRSEGKAAETAITSWSRALRGARDLLAGLGIATTTAALLRAIRGIGEQMIRNVEEMASWGEQLGTTTQAVSGLVEVANLADVSFETLAVGSAAVSKAIDQLRKGAPTTIALFARLGLSAKDFPTDDTAANLEVVARAFDKLAASGTRTAMAQELAGKNGKALLPFFREYVRLGGQAGAQALSQQRGTFVDPKTEAIVKAINSGLKSVQSEATGVGRALVTALGPETARMLDTIVLGFQTAKQAMTTIYPALQPLVAIFGLTVRVVGGLAQSMFTVLQSNLDKLKVTITGAQAMAELISKGKFEQAGKVANALDKFYEALDQREHARLREIVETFSKAPTIKIPEPTGGPPPGADAKANLVAERAAAAAEAKLFAEMARNREEIEKASYDRGRATIGSYFQARRATVEASLRAELAQLELERAKIDASEDDPVKRAAERERIAGEARLAGVRAQGDLAKIAADQENEVDALAKAATDSTREQLKLQGQAHAARMLEIAEEVAVERQRLGKIGYEPSVLEEKLAAFREAREAAADFDDALARANVELTAVEQRPALFKRQLPGLRETVEALRQMAVALGPAAQKSVEELANRLESLTVRSHDLTDAIRGAGQQAIESFLNSLDKGTAVLRSFALAIAQALQQMAATRIATGIMNWLLPTRMASGGLLRGPGSSTSDSIPILASAGEYVVPERLMRMPGMFDYLEGMRTGRVKMAPASLAALQGLSRMPQLRPVSMDASARLQRFAEGGAVQRPTGGGALTGDLSIGLDDGLVARHVEAYLRSHEGQRTVVQVVTRNRRSVKGGLGLG